MSTIGKKNYLYTFNKFLCILFCIWFAWPYANYYLGMYFGMTLSFVWLVTSGYFILMKKWSIDLIMVVAFFTTMIPYVLTGEFRYSSFNMISILGTFYLFFIGMFIFHYYYYYKKDFVFLGKLALITIVFYSVGAVQTYAGLLIYPEASRYLAVGGLNPEIRAAYTSIGIGGFNFVYSSVFLLIMIVYIFTRQKSKYLKKRRLLIIFLILVIFSTIVKSSYTIAILISIFGCILVIAVKNRRVFYALLFLSTFILLTVSDNVLSHILYNIANIFSNNLILNEKFLDLAQTISRNQGNSSQTLYRMELYTSSLSTFVKNPLFGINGPFGNINDRIGGHSGWLDMMAYFGLFSTIPLFSAIGLNFKKILQINKKEGSFFGIYSVQLLFIVYGIINPILYVYQIGLIMFLIVPSMPYIYCYLRKKSFTTPNKIVNTREDE